MDNYQNGQNYHLYVFRCPVDMKFGYDMRVGHFMEYNYKTRQTLTVYLLKTLEWFFVKYTSRSSRAPFTSATKIVPFLSLCPVPDENFTAVNLFPWVNKIAGCRRLAEGGSSFLSSPPRIPDSRGPGEIRRGHGFLAVTVRRQKRRVRQVTRSLVLPLPPP